MPRIFYYGLTVPDDAVDAHGHVNNLEYLRWMQDAAVQHSAAQGWPPERYFGLGESWFIRSHFIEYLRPASAGQALVIATWVSGLESRRSPRRYLCALADGTHILARAETMWTYVDLRTGRAIRIRDDVRRAFEIVTADVEVEQRLAAGDFTIHRHS